MKQHLIKNNIYLREKGTDENKGFNINYSNYKTYQIQKPFKKSFKTFYYFFVIKENDWF